MNLCRVVITLAVMTMAAGAILAICLIWRDRRQRRQKAKPDVSSEDLERYRGKHVMTDGYGGPVLAAGDNIEEMMAEAAALDDEVQHRLVYVYLTLIDKQYYRSDE